MTLCVRDAICGYPNRIVLNKISLEIGDGDVLCLLGPNGRGKTTLFKTILGFLPLYGGSILLDDEDISLWSLKMRAQYIGYVPQSHTPAFPFSVFDVALMGRQSHLSQFGTPSHKDELLTEEILVLLGIDHLRSRIYTELSGGERQMVLIARALVQQPKLLVLDEPTSNLDIGNQMCVLKLLSTLSKEGLGIIMTTHEPGHAFLCGTKSVLLQRNGTIESGPVDEIVTEENLLKAYGVPVRVVTTVSDNGSSLKGCIPSFFT